MRPSCSVTISKGLRQNAVPLGGRCVRQKCSRVTGIISPAVTFGQVLVTDCIVSEGLYATRQCMLSAKEQYNGASSLVTAHGMARELSARVADNQFASIVTCCSILEVLESKGAAGSHLARAEETLET